MDTITPKSYRKPLLTGLGITAALVMMSIALWIWMPRGLQIDAAEARIATVEQGVFLNEMVVRASATPLNSVILDSVESGRVEEVYGRDGALVIKGAPLFRLSNSQRQIELLARQSDQATQISNISNLRAALEISKTDHERRLSDLQFNVQQAEKKYARSEKLAQQGFISAVALEDQQDALEQQRHVLQQEMVRSNEELDIKRAGIAQMEQANARLASGLQLLNANIDALTVRAPTSGRLTDIHLQVGEAVTPGQHIGRIDDPDRYKLKAAVDEYYLNRVTVGRQGTAQQDEKNYPVEVSRVYPQIDKGQFNIELVFRSDQPAHLNPGQSLDTQLTLGDPKPALILPAGSYINDSGGAWVYVMRRDAKTAERRNIKIGRRSNTQIEILSGLQAGERVIISSYTGYGQAVRLQLN